MLPAPTIRKFFRESFLAEEPIRLTDTEAQLTWLTPVQERLDKISRVECKFHVIHRLKLSEQVNQLDLTISPNESGRHWGESERFSLFFSGDEAERRGFLKLKDGGWRRSRLDDARVSSVAEIETLIEKVKARQDRNALRDKKNTRLSNLKESGMKARLRELAAEHDFGFAIGQNTKNVNLSLRVAGRKTGFHFSFAKGKFDDVLEALPSLIANFEQMAKLGITFRTHNRRWGQGEWIFPE